MNSQHGLEHYLLNRSEFIIFNVYSSVISFHVKNTSLVLFCYKDGSFSIYDKNEIGYNRICMDKFMILIKEECNELYKDIICNLDFFI